MDTYRFTATELAVLTSYMAPEALPLDETAQTDLGVDAHQFIDAEESLRERHLLVRPPTEELAVAGELAAVLATTMFPQRLGILRTVVSNHAEPVMYFSFSHDGIARNFVDDRGGHIFESFGDTDEALEGIVSSIGAQSSYAGSSHDTSLPLEILMADASALTMLMIIKDPAESEPEVHNFAWLIARKSLWFVDASRADSPQARPIDRARLREVIAQTLDWPSVALS